MLRMILISWFKEDVGRDDCKYLWQCKHAMGWSVRLHSRIRPLRRNFLSNEWLGARVWCDTAWKYSLTPTVCKFKCMDGRSDWVLEATRNGSILKFHSTLLVPRRTFLVLTIIQFHCCPVSKFPPVVRTWLLVRMQNVEAATFYEIIRDVANDGGISRIGWFVCEQKEANESLLSRSYLVTWVRPIWRWTRCSVLCGSVIRRLEYNVAW
jgi:hypothetical protein